MADDPDRELVERIRSGEDRAFNDLMARYKKPVLNFIYRIVGNADDADDLAQETFVRVYRGIPKFTFGRARFSSWMFQVARNAALDHLRKRIQPLEYPVEQIPDLGKNPADQSDLSDRSDALAAAVASLPEDQRTALVLSEYHGQSHAEIAEVMDCSEKSVESRLYRARQTLREKLKSLLG